MSVKCPSGISIIPSKHLATIQRIGKIVVNISGTAVIVVHELNDCAAGFIAPVK
ncbi:MAG: hypothetical protein MJ223_02545 [Mycoplasmoidaceae bacterium]|nr:hypothetical protein [Mycoplasmoidaceae bacterium]